MCTKAHFQSLDYNKMVEGTVIDAWTCILNENEILRSDSSPMQLFLNTEIMVYANFRSFSYDLLEDLNILAF